MADAVTAESTSGGHIDKARFHAGTHIRFASIIGKEQVEKIEVSIPPFTENILGGGSHSVVADGAYSWN